MNHIYTVYMFSFTCTVTKRHLVLINVFNTQLFFFLRKKTCHVLEDCSSPGSHLYFKMSSIKSIHKYFLWVSCETNNGYLESYDGGSVML